uniref:DNL-type domain-containing protein n=1 Tax=Oryza brachyantha TaxID=4533 RepID=J3L1P1_ORYBR
MATAAAAYGCSAALPFGASISCRRKPPSRVPLASFSSSKRGALAPGCTSLPIAVCFPLVFGLGVFLSLCALSPRRLRFSCRRRTRAVSACSGDADSDAAAAPAIYANSQKGFQNLKLNNSGLVFNNIFVRFTISMSCKHLSSDSWNSGILTNHYVGMALMASFCLKLQEGTFDLNLPRRSLLVQFTCNACGERTKRLINRVAYERGTVFLQCGGCQVYHKFVDNLGLVVEYDLREDNGVNTDTEA